ncbi:hypothetical protein [Chrysodeixis includens nucleopolyhedrovirus]|uniref:Ac52 n=1 Tax=Chrysodeixis includens nucleopolyhedrovirus TaxID=1207438 RepID=A0A5B8YUT1_9ABAC|nr:hypothetical protein QKU06_gp036 [Chrysodeixis includens nucleopolyhedrovirus]QED40564.1 hypothetical protein [Chrysodeixis includens nucleopolyhedrovirus]
MELIKPFIQYSRLYRFSQNERERQRIFNSWSQVTNYTGASSLSTLSNQTCDFCYKIQNGVRFCSGCLFPLVLPENDIVQELSAYSIVSACFYEAVFNLESKDVTVIRPVWEQRIHFVWCMYDTSNKLCKIDNAESCVQCGLRRNDDEKNNDSLFYNCFSFDLFCKQCLFPMFARMSAAG